MTRAHRDVSNYKPQHFNVIDQIKPFNNLSVPGLAWSVTALTEQRESVCETSGAPLYMYTQPCCQS